jgi:glycosyltransferase involved in cell wall biosynthesis
MRFCMVTTFYPPYNFGGDGLFVQALSRALVESGHEVEVVHCEDAFRLKAGSVVVPEIEDDDVKVHRLKSSLGALSPILTQQLGRPALKSAKLKAVLNRDFDVVNFHNISLIGGPKILSLSSAPVTFYTLHEHWLLCPTHSLWKNQEEECLHPQCFGCSVKSGVPPQIWRYTSLLKQNLPNVDVLLSPSAYTAEVHQRRGILTPLMILPTFSRLAPATTRSPETSTRPRFVFSGRITAAKGVQDLLETFAGLTDYELSLAGEGELLPSLRSQFAHCQNIRFLGRLTDTELVELYQSATALVVCSRAPEVFPLVVLEALACGTPAIVRDVGGSREAVDQTGAGLVYQNSDELIRGVHSLAQDKDLHSRLGRLARSGYQTHYSAQNYLRSYLALIDELHGISLVITPLTFLGGSFYSINMLPPVWQKVSLLNPVVYLVSGFRWSFYEISDVGVGLSLGMTATFLALCLAAIGFIRINRRGNAIELA